MISMWGRSKLTMAIARRDRCPPLNAAPEISKSLASMPHCSKWLRKPRSQLSERFPGNLHLISCIGDNVKSIWSAWCWFTTAKRAFRLRHTVPTVGSNSPSKSLSKVLFPLPFSPTRTIRDLQSTLNSCGWHPTSRKSGSDPGYAKATSWSSNADRSSRPAPSKVRGRSVSSASAASSSASFAASFSSFWICTFREPWLVLPAAACPDTRYFRNLAISSVRTLLRCCQLLCCSLRARSHVE
mmetsp:Transcript_133004/g.331867  ORF Transcript_133004/g.331867 Transcript_133004/m.331867 type:complete len:241 (-) Transcript_133004:1354-2076(-)